MPTPTPKHSRGCGAQGFLLVVVVCPRGAPLPLTSVYHDILLEAAIPNKQELCPDNPNCFTYRWEIYKKRATGQFASDSGGNQWDNITHTFPWDRKELMDWDPVSKSSLTIMPESVDEGGRELIPPNNLLLTKTT